MDPLSHRKKILFWVDFYKSAYVSLLISTPLCKALLVHSRINVHCLVIFPPPNMKQMQSAQTLAAWQQNYQEEDSDAIFINSAQKVPPSFCRKYPTVRVKPAVTQLKSLFLDGFLGITDWEFLYFVCFLQMSEGDLRWRADQVWPDNIIILVNEPHSLCFPVQLSGRTTMMGAARLCY